MIDTQQVIEVLTWVIGLGATALCGVIGWVGQQVTAKFNSMDKKLDTLSHIMLLCDGCSKAAKEYQNKKSLDE